MILDAPLRFNQPCQKQIVVAFLETADKKHVYIGSNWCETPVKPNECPRVLEGYASGEGYHLCKEVCHQPAHAEVDALNQAGKNAEGGTMYIMGHIRVCEQCIELMKVKGVKQWVILK